ncbi:MAG: adenosylcobinamide-GDP ribazoletransferase [Clostridia bacterium]|nr:adenosylcobinamide-GDP ribazoletransferase [Clostridia bacterium]
MIIKSIIIAFSMYSKIPMPRVDWDKKSMKYVFCFFPAIGIIIGIIIYLAGLLLINGGINPLLFGSIMTVIPIFITGGIHFDGFLDTMDGINSYADRDKRLEILKDSNSGAFAIIGGLVYFTLSVGFWSAVKYNMLSLIAIGYVISRTLSALSVISFPMAKNRGLAAAFGNNADKLIVKIILIIYTLLEFVFALYISLKGGCVIISISILCYIYHYYNCIKNFGGITGDLAGYFLQICELCILISIVTFYSILN